MQHYWNDIVLIVCALLAIFACWKEFTRENKLRFVWRIVASLVAVIMLAAIALPVSYPGTSRLAVKNAAVLLTPGMDKDSLSDFKNDSLFTTDAAIQKEYPGAKLVTADELNAVSPKIGQLHILGFGLSADQLKRLDSLPVIFHPASAPSGVSAISWTGKLKQGEPVRVQGKFSNTGTNVVRVILKGLNTTVDSIFIPAKKETVFDLKDIPKNTGRSVYRLVALTGHDTLANDPLPVNIDPVTPLKILILSASPGFEDRFLKNWLSENGFAVAARAAISKDKFNSSYVNMPQTPLDHLTPALLDKFDVLIGDLSVLKSLSGAEASALKQHVTEKGLGLIVNADTTTKTSSWLQADFPLQKLTVKDQKPVSLLLAGKKTAAITFNAEQLLIGFREGTQVLVSNEQNQELVVTTIAGAGKLVFNTLNDTYSWMLAGNKKDYSALWSLLISKAVKPAMQAEDWTTASAIPVVDQPVTIQIETAVMSGMILADNTPVSPAQGPELPFQWRGTFWPTTAGWYPVKKADGVSNWLYVYGKNDWKTLTALKTIADTRQYATDHAPINDVTKQIHQKENIPAPKIYFYILLLAACTFLWVESKLTS